jgi:hypothetical protein
VQNSSAFQSSMRGRSECLYTNSQIS